MKRNFLRNFPGSQSRFYQNKTTRQMRSLELIQLSIAPLCGSVVTGAILAGYLSYIGISDTVTAILMQLLVCGASIQFIAPLLYQKTKRRITIVRWFYAVWRFFCVLLICVSFIKNPNMQIVTFAVLYLTAFFATYLAEPAYVEYLSTIAPRRLRARFFAKRDAVSIASTTLCSLVLGFLLDRFRDTGNEGGGFLLLYGIAAVGAVIQVACVFRMKDMPIRKPAPVKGSPLRTLADPLRDKAFRKVILFSVLYNVSIYLANSYLSIYLVSGLQLSYAYIAAMNAIMTAARILASFFWGRQTNRIGYGKVAMYSLILLAISHIGYFFATPDTYGIVLPITNIVYGVSWGGLAVGVINIFIQQANPKKLTTYLGVNGGIGAIAGFLAAIAGATLADSLKAFQFSFFGLEIHYMQIMFAITTVAMCLTALYLRLVLVRQIQPDQ